MQIHVQNAPFVYNPNTISVGLGFSKGGKKTLVEYSTSEISVLCSICIFYPSPPFYITSHQRAGLSLEKAEGGVSQKKN